VEHHYAPGVDQRVRVSDGQGLGLGVTDALVRLDDATYLRRGESWWRLRDDLDSLLRLSVQELRRFLERDTAAAMPPQGAAIRAPIQSQEVWAAGVTYRRSLEARTDEAVSSDPYDRVYRAARPELFFKATASRVRGPGEAVFIRSDSTWDVPEPELAVVCNSRMEVVGYTIGNDVSSRSIEGENPLYLPQAKVFDGSCALGPVIALAWDYSPADRAIELEISRNDAVAYRNSTSTAAMRREIPELVDYLGRDQRFDAGCILLTGTGIVPPPEFSLQDGDVVTIRIDGIGELQNSVRRHAVTPPAGR
jgi:2-dehydro-3-deoxy-D-arabinonate dehydratase